MEDNVPPEVKQLERRQDFILKRLEALRLEVEKLSENQRKSPESNSASRTGAQSQQLTSGVPHDLVISSSPNHPPLSLLVLKELLAEQYSVLASTYVHSSVSGISDGLKSAFSTTSGLFNRNAYQLVLTLIWKNDPLGTSLMVSPNVQTTVQGEANIARYISRLMNPAYDGFDIITATEIDGWLDLSAQLLHGNNKEKAGVLRTLNARLGKGSWVVGSCLTLADIVMWSALQQNKMTQAVPSNVKKWLESCNSLSVFSRALSVASVL